MEFTSVPENYYRKFGTKLIDTEKHWVFDCNPYVIRGRTATRKVRLWNYNPVYKPRPSVYLSLAEKCAGPVDAGDAVVLRHPRLYRFEDFPFEKRTKILLQPQGVSHGRLPPPIIEHVLKKYAHCDLHQIGTFDEKLGIPWIETKTLWDLAEVISQARMLIGPDSGPIWIAACYPDVVVKKVRTKPPLDVLKQWVPLDVSNLHAQWDDLQLFQVYNTTKDDVGFTSSYLKI